MSLELRLALQEQRSADLAERVRRLLGPFTGTEEVLDAGCGTGSVAFALAPHVAEVVGADTRVEYLDAARSSAPANVRLVEADVMALPFGYAEFDLVCCVRVLHHVRRPELAVSELARVARPGGKVFIVDQLGSIDPLLSLEMDRFERLRDATHQRLLPDADIRGYLDANDLVLLSSEVTREKVDLEERLTLAGFDDEAKARIRGPVAAKPYEIEVGWYVARKPGAGAT
jgi:ubiquinone/menaquinone biosynthesis C-methylase UbiE